MFSGLRTSSIWLPFATHLPRNPNFKVQPPSPSSQMNQAPLHFTDPFVVLMTAGTVPSLRFTCLIHLHLFVQPPAHPPVLANVAPAYRPIQPNGECAVPPVPSRYVQT